MTSEIIWQSTIAGLATLLGAIIILLTGQLEEKALAFLLGFAGGIMTSVVIFDLIPSSLVYGNALVALLGFCAGLIFMLSLDIIIALCPSLKNKNLIESNNRLLKMGYLIAIGIALHDLPEGVAIAVGYAAENDLGLIIALSIGLHNIPEGMAIAAPLAMSKIPKSRIIIICILISFFTPIGALLGILLINISSHFISLLLALAGGAMAFIVKNELIPESHHKHPSFARFGFVIGIILILLIGIYHS